MDMLKIAKESWYWLPGEKFYYKGLQGPGGL